MAELADGRDGAKSSDEVELALLGQRRAQPLAKPELRGPPTWLASGSSDVVRVVSRTCSSISFRNCSMRAAAATALARSTRMIAKLRLAIGEVELDQARGHQHAPDQDEEDDHVLAEEPAA